MLSTWSTSSTRKPVPFFFLTATVLIVYIQCMDFEPNGHPLVLPPISPAAGKPLYEQLIDAVKSEIGAGRLAPHTPLPSFRALAAQLLVSVITVRRAYEELERDGVIYRRQGLGTFVSENGAARSREIKVRRAEELMREAVRECREAGLSENETQRMVRKVIREEEVRWEQ